MFFQNTKTSYYFFLVFLFFNVFDIEKIQAQNSGVYFQANPASEYLRTGIDLSQNNFFEFENEFELSFKIFLRNENFNDFGYIVRIVSQNNSNIDLIYDSRSQAHKEIVLIRNEQIIKKLHSIKRLTLLNKWLTVRINLNFQEKQLKCYLADSLFLKTKTELKKNNQFKILFGANKYKHFKTKQVAPFNLKDIKISENNSTVLFWPLNEENGDIAIDKIQNKKAKVYSPVWLRTKSTKWEKIYDSHTKGHVKTLFNRAERCVNLISNYTIQKLYLKNKALTTVRFSDSLSGIETNLFFIDSIEDRLKRLNIKSKKISYLDSVKYAWKLISEFPNELPVNKNANFLYLNKKNSFYFFGGFDGKSYKKDVSQINFRQLTYRKILSGNDFEPMYKTALGSNTAQDSVYLLGGYGSKTGNPIINPHQINKLYVFDVKNETISELYSFDNMEINNTIENSLYIVSDDFLFLNLIEESKKIKIQLVKGSLNKPVWKDVANAIELESNLNTNITFFSCPAIHKLITVISIYHPATDTTNTKCFTLYYEPETSKEDVLIKESGIKMWYWILLIVLLDLVILLVSLWQRNRKKKSLAIVKKIKKEKQTEFFSTALLEDTWSEAIEVKEKVKIYKSIFLFGGFSFFYTDGNDISGKFSPLLKKLFILILLNSVKNNKGISSKNLIEQIWKKQADKNTKNNLAVNIGKLRKVIGSEIGLNITNTTGYWRVDLSEKQEDFYCDYWECWELLNQEGQITHESIIRIIEILKRGLFLPGIEHECFDSFKANLSNKVIDTLLAFVETQKIMKDAAFVIQIADTITRFDMANEYALKFKCRALVSLGKHSLAKDTYDAFTKEYKTLYQESYSKSFKEIME